MYVYILILQMYFKTGILVCRYLYIMYIFKNTIIRTHLCVYIG